MRPPEDTPGRSTRRSTVWVSRYAQVNLDGITVRKAVTEADFDLVAHLRATGYARFSSESDPTLDWVDTVDRMRHNTVLIAYDEAAAPVATMRMQDSRTGALEITRFVPLDTLLRPELRPPLQIGRLSVLKGPRATDAMFGMFKASWLWCLKNDIGSMVIASPPWARHIHEFMHFEHLGPRGNFSHALARNALHITMALSVPEAEPLWRRHRNPLCMQIFDTEHPLLIFDQ